MPLSTIFQIYWGNWSIRRKPPTWHKSLTNYHIMFYRVHLTWAGFELTTYNIYKKGIKQIVILPDWGPTLACCLLVCTRLVTGIVEAIVTIPGVDMEVTVGVITGTTDETAYPKRKCFFKISLVVKDIKDNFKAI